MMIEIQILTPIPAIAESVLAESILGRAREAGLITIEAVDLRRWTNDRHRTVDDAPYGGGPGMIMKIAPIAAALAELRRPESKVIFLTPQGKPLRQTIVREFAREQHLILLCGHYEGIDQRVVEHLIDEEISIGDYILTNGVLGALVLSDAIARLIPGVLGDDQSAVTESFETGLLDHPHYTRPEEFNGWKVPPVLLSGNHGAVATWRAERAMDATKKNRPDLLR
ncbi:MAG: tRNA (guanosine(37)-N1)-methyltransferase TrmD [Verrucomicrobia bacterium]|jgi:tRNA (guanine37-N1)-methyltransferase|nr:MAG: tRNA (guanosine(37)-N1)-methyltransferase TrmD [Verrucomicrobiota bacterium]